MRAGEGGYLVRRARGIRGLVSFSCRADEGVWWVDPALGSCFRPRRWEGRMRGLLGTRAGEAPCLVLAPCRSIHTVGMRYSLDVAFAGQDGLALRVCRGLPPGRVASCRGAAWVLERPHQEGPWLEAGQPVPLGPPG